MKNKTKIHFTIKKKSQNKWCNVLINLHHLYGSQNSTYLGLKNYNLFYSIKLTSPKNIHAACDTHLTWTWVELLESDDFRLDSSVDHLSHPCNVSQHCCLLHLSLYLGFSPPLQHYCAYSHYNKQTCCDFAHTILSKLVYVNFLWICGSTFVHQYIIT